MANFNEINSVAQADAILKKATPAFIRTNAAYVAGDHFQGGREYIGPPPPPVQERAAMLTLEKLWVPEPMVEEMIDGHVAGAIGREPAFEMALRRPLTEGEDAHTPEEIDAKNLVDADIARWFDRAEVMPLLQEWTGRLRWATRAPLRLFVPPDLLSEEGDEFVLDVEEGDIAGALEQIYLECPNVEAATVTTDAGSRQKAGLYRYSEKSKERNGAPRNGAPRKCVEMVFVAKSGDGYTKGDTVLRIIEKETIVAEIAFPCGGYSLMYEGRAPLLLTDPVIRSQRALNFINTMIPIVDAYAGYPTKEYINLKKPVDEVTGEEVAASVGPGQTMHWYSEPYQDPETGEQKYLPPQIVVSQSADTTSLRYDKAEYRRSIARACSQEFTMFDGSGDISAVALIQMRARFANDLLKTTPVIEGALRWLQGAVYCFALYLCGRENEIETFLETFRPHAQCKPYTGPMTPDEIRVLIELVKARLISRELAQVMFGVEDVDNEMLRLRREMGDSIELKVQQAELFTIWAQTFDVELAAELAGLDAETLAIILKNQQVSVDE